jgi:hypothetical protein
LPAQYEYHQTPDHSILLIHKSFAEFSNKFARNLFQLIVKCFHLADNKNSAGPGELEYVPCSKVQPFTDTENF